MQKQGQYKIKFANIQEQEDDIETMPQHISKQNCEICNVQTESVKEIIEIPNQSKIILCGVCNNQIEETFQNIKPLQQGKLKCFGKQKVQFRNLCKYTLIGLYKGICNVCLEEDQILFRVSQECLHVFCVKCIEKWGECALEKSTCINNVRCLQDECTQKVDDLILFQIKNYLYPSKILENLHGFFCSKCKTHMITIERVEGKIQIRNENIQFLEYNQQKCVKCKNIICRSCLKYHKVSIQCQFEKLFQENKQKLGIKSCPQCKQYVQNEKCIDLKKVGKLQYFDLIAQCSFCGYNFCWRCNSSASLYSPPQQHNNQQITPSFKYCYVCQKRYQSCVGCLYRFFSLYTLQIIGLAFLYLGIATMVMFFSIITFGVYIVGILLKEFLILMYQNFMQALQIVKRIKNKIGNTLFIILFPVIFALMLVYFVLAIMFGPLIFFIVQFCSCRTQEIVDLNEQVI